MSVHSNFSQQGGIAGYIQKNKVIRRFTAQCLDQTEILALSFNDLIVMKSDFNEIFGELFNNARGMLKKELL
jgi:hypothetical protein